MGAGGGGGGALFRTPVAILCFWQRHVGVAASDYTVCCSDSVREGLGEEFRAIPRGILGHFTDTVKASPMQKPCGENLTHNGFP